jgi:aldose 1-epimerase
VAGQYDLRGGQPLAALELDDVFGDLAFQDDECTCRLVDELAGLEVGLWFDRFFRELVIYTPPARPAICLEPYTCATDAVHLDERGIDAGWRVLEPGAAAAGRYVISIRALG